MTSISESPVKNLAMPLHLSLLQQLVDRFPILPIAFNALSISGVEQASTSKTHFRHRVEQAFMPAVQAR
jgi:hypothetical protein